ncbi:RDD family protein [Undibacterium sp. Di27W]|uniref:RDD family protein n=1 Tax=Undibacterium sp. Di27W TaxID=3413036 RepID=UPI003BF178E6
MDALRVQLHENYMSRETVDLLALGIKPDLHDHEYATLESVLSVRGVDISVLRAERDQLKIATALQLADNKRARLYKRLLALLIDTVGVALLLVALGLLITVTMPNLFKQTNRAILILWLLYLLFKDGFDGQSLGKRIMKIRVVHADTEQACNLPQSLIRNLALLTVVDWFFILGRSKFRLGDLIARTKVMKASAVK